MVANREDAIKYGVGLGKSSNEISRALALQGWEPLNYTETSLVDAGQYGTNIGQRTLSGIANFGKGVATMAGAAYQYATDKDARDAINKQLEGATATDAVNMLLSNYNTNLYEIANDPKTALLHAQAGARTDPFLATLDLAPVIGTVGGKAVKAGSKALSKLDKSTPNLPKFINTIAETDVPVTRVVNEIINTSRDVPAKRVAELEATQARLAKAPKEHIAQAYKNLEEGTRVGSNEVLKLTDDLKNFGKEVDSWMKEAGMNPAKTREVAVSQHVLREFQNDTGIPLTVDDITKAIKDDNYAKKMGLPPEILKSYGDRAEQAFNEGLIFPIRHASSKVGKNLGLVTDSDRAAKAMAERRYGNQTYEALAEGFQQTGYKPLLEQLNKAEQAQGALDEIAKLGKKVDNLDTLELGKGETIISPNKLKVDFGKTLEKGGNIEDDITRLTEGLSDLERATYLDDLYIVRKKDVDMLNKAFTKSGRVSNAGWFENLSAIGKLNALTSLRYIAGNEFANITSNAMEGITLADYIKAYRNKNLVPTALRETTSYKGYLGKDIPSEASLKDSYNILFKNIKEGTNGDILGRLKDANKVFALPIFKSASAFEYLDRSANYFKQAERLAKELGKDSKEILEEARKKGGNNPTYREIKRRIDNSLGDYAGVDYSLDPRITFTLRQGIPFYRPFTQGTRVLTNVVTKHPLNYQIQAKLPSLIGNDLSKRGEQAGVIPDEEYGGMPINAAFGNYPSRVIYNPYSNLTAATEALDPRRWLDAENGIIRGGSFALAPFYALQGKNRFGREGTLPNSFKGADGKTYTMDNNGNIVNAEMSGSNIARLFAAQVANAYFTPVSLTNNSILPLLSIAANKDYRTPSDVSLLGQVGDMKLPMIAEGGNMARVGLAENLAPITGFTIRQTYKKKPEGAKLKDIKTAKRKARRNTLINERGN